MKTPSWAIAVAIFMIFFGGCDIIGNRMTLALPSDMNELMSDSVDLDSVQNIFSQIKDSLAVRDSNAQDTAVLNVLENVVDIAEGALTQSEEARLWTVRLAYAGVFAGILYLLAGVFLLAKPRFAIRFAYLAIIFTACVSLAQGVVMAIDYSVLSNGIFGWFGVIFGLIIDVIIFMVIYSGDKTAYGIYADLDETSVQNRSPL